MRTALAALALGLSAGIAHAGSAEADLRAHFAMCAKNASGERRLAEAVAGDRPRLRPHLASLDPRRFCTCRLEHEREAFGVERTAALNSLNDDTSRLPPEQSIPIYEKKAEIAVDCLELATIGRLAYADPDEARLRDRIDRCAELPAFAMLAQVLLSPPPTAQDPPLDPPKVCACFYEGQRKELGLAETLRWSSLSATAGIGVDGSQRSRIQGRKGALFRACAGRR